MSFLRWLVAVNAALWLGAGVFLTFGVGPAIFSQGVGELVTRQQAGAVAQAILVRYFAAQLLWAGVAVIASCRAVSWGWRYPRIALPNGLGLMALVLVANFWLQPRLHELNQRRYTPSLAAEERESVGRQFGKLHGLSQIGNLLVLCGVLFHGWQQGSYRRGERHSR